jgi:hypothetical protein
MRLMVNWRKEDAGGMPLVQLAVAQNGHAWTPPRCQPLYMYVGRTSAHAKVCQQTVVSATFVCRNHPHASEILTQSRE